MRSSVLISAVLAAMTLSACASPQAVTDVTIGLSPSQDAVALPREAEDLIEAAIAELPTLVDAALSRSGVPGAAVTVVHGGETIYAEGFGLRSIQGTDTVSPDTVFQIASVSKSLTGTAIAKAVTDGFVTWTTPISTLLPGFRLSDPVVTERATIGDYMAHRTGLQTGGGDDLEDLGFDRAYILDHLVHQPLSEFRSTYHYSNFGITVAGEAVATASGMTWEDYVRQTVFEPLGMGSTSAVHQDFLDNPHRALLHAQVDGKFLPLYDRNADAEAPAGGVSSTVVDLAEWMKFILASGEIDGVPHISQEALLPAISSQMISGTAHSPSDRTSHYGYGFNVGSGPAGRTTVSHSGAFSLGAGTNYLLVPSLDLGIVTLTNGSPVGVAEAVNAAFMDLAQFGHVTRDWGAGFAAQLGAYMKPVGDLVGQTAPSPAPRPELSGYVGAFENSYFGPLLVEENAGALVARLGPNARYAVTLTPWSDDVFSFAPTGENAPAGSLSSARFTRDGNGLVTSLTLQYFDAQGLGTFTRIPIIAD